eukprot:PhM_4_TR4522/c0_g1_i1/m.103275
MSASSSSMRNVVRVQLERPSHISLPEIRALPKAPGNNWTDTAFKGSHSKRQVLQNELRGNFGNNYKPTFVRDDGDVSVAPPSSCDTLHKCLTNEIRMQNVQKVPSEVVLAFKGYFKEAVIESAQEAERVRRVNINFYVVDDTVMISEFSVNSGLPTGVMLKRQRIKRPDGTHLEAEDFNVGSDVNIFGRVYRLVSCDSSTREYMANALGMYVGDEEPYPADQYADYRATKVEPKKKTRTYEDQDLRLTLEQQAKGRVVTNYPGDVMRVKRYLQDSDKVLRFFAYWDDRDQPHGDIRLFELRYYVQDDTIFVGEQLTANCGRDGVHSFCSRRRCPKPEFQCKGSDLTFSHRVNGIACEYHGDDDERVYYGVQDFDVGSTINVFGREFVLYDADTFTRSFYERNLGTALRPALEPPESNVDRTVIPKPPKPTGFGSDADSMASCGSLMLKAPKSDTKKWISMDGKVLRFKMKLHEPQVAEDRLREFILSFHLSDDTITVTECAVPNTGFLGGKMLHQKVKKYKGEGPNVYYGASDFVVGKPLLINSHCFVITSMDKFTEEYYSLGSATLDKHDTISNAAIQKLLDRLRTAVDAKYVSLTEAFRRWDTDHDGRVTLGELSEVIRMLNLRCRDEELAALMAQFDLDRSGAFSFQEFMAMMSRDDEVGCRVVSESKPTDSTQFLRTCHIRSEAKDRRVVRRSALKLLKEKLAERRINGFEMFRMISTIPRGPQGPAVSYITPLQLRAALTEVLDLKLAREAEEEIVSYFFPAIPAGVGDRELAGDPRLRMELKDFHRCLVDLGNIGQLPPPS